MRHHTDPLTPMENADYERPSQSHKNPHGIDQRIRDRGYEIESRPKKGEPIWKMNGILFTQSNVILREGLK